MAPQSALAHALPTATRWIHHLLSHRDLEGRVVLDATMGNGHDTLFLAQKVGERGKVYGFDIQDTATANTRHRLLENRIPESRFELHTLSHARFPEVLPLEHQGKLSAVLFNLGYLPGGDKSVITQRESTLTAIAHSLDWLEPNGLITIAAYPGHEGGREEKDEIEQWLCTLDPNTFEVQKIGYLNFRPTTPVSYLIRRRTAVAPTKA